jgi:glycosyltransferase involved in cell wall biosynthesis
VSRRIVVFGSPSGLAIWRAALANIPGFDSEFVLDRAAKHDRSRLPVLTPLREVRMAARGADVVIVISTLLGSVVAAIQRQSPVIAVDVGAARFAEMHPRVGRRVIAFTLDLPAAIVGITRAHAAALSGIRPQARVHVVHQPARPPAFSWQPDRTDPYVLCVGSSGRDLWMLSQAARGLAFDVRIVEGGRELVPASGTRVHDRLSPNVKRHGPVSSDAYVGLLSAASAVVLPLPYSSFPIGVTVMLDAMAAGIPVVATAVPSVTDYQGQATAFTVPVGDSEALAGALTTAVEDPDQAMRVGLAGRWHVEKIAAADVIGARFAGLLAEVA